MKRITLHWDVGDYKLSDSIWNHYHFAVDGDGVWHENPYHPPEVNTAEGVNSGRYLRHCGGGNTDNIGVAVLGMLGTSDPSSRPFNPGQFPIKMVQMQAAARGVARLAQVYDIPITPETVFLHCEFDSKRGSASTGKWDVSYWEGMEVPIDFAYAGHLWRSMVKAALPEDEDRPDPIGDLIAEDLVDNILQSNTVKAALASLPATIAAAVSDNAILAGVLSGVVGLLAGYIVWSRIQKSNKAKKAAQWR